MCPLGIKEEKKRVEVKARNILAFDYVYASLRIMVASCVLHPFGVMVVRTLRIK